MPNVTSFFGLLEKLQSSDITVHQDRCVVVRNRNATCTTCADVCTSGCISYEDNQLIISPEKCVGCGTCATMCPTGALEAHRPDDDELIRSCLSSCEAADGEVIIACEQILTAAEGLYDRKKVVGVTCLGRVEESLLITLAAAGSKRVSLVRARCAECEHAVGLQTTGTVCDTANALLETWDDDMRVEIVGKFPSIARLEQDREQGFDADRRDFFTSIKGEAKDVAVVTMDYAAKEVLGGEEREESRYVKVMDDGTLPHHIPTRRALLLDSLAALGDPRDELMDIRLWGHVIIDRSLCSSCQMCATFCPTGAISKFEDEDGIFGVRHRPADCVKCHCCVDICPEGALSLSDEVFAVDLLSGAMERYEMKPLKNPPGNPHQIWYAMKDLLGCDQVYER